MSYTLGHSAAENIEILKKFVKAMNEVELDDAKTTMLIEAEFAVDYLDGYINLGNSNHETRISSDT